MMQSMILSSVKNDEDLIDVYCYNCKMKQTHIICGFKKYNERFRCLTCGHERHPKMLEKWIHG